MHIHFQIVYTKHLHGVRKAARKHALTAQVQGGVGAAGDWEGDKGLMPHPTMMKTALATLVQI